MKAYYLSIRGDDDQGGYTVFANTVQEARKLVSSTDLLYDSWLDVQATRDKKYDNMENLPKAQLELIKWRDGWRWFNMGYPDPDEATDEEFLQWYKSEFDEN